MKSYQFVFYVFLFSLTNVHSKFTSNISVRISKGYDDYTYRQSVLLRFGFGSSVWSTIDSVDLNSLKLTGQCIQSLKTVNQSIGLGEHWPFKLIESSGRAPSDLTGSGYLDIGNYDQCLGLSWTRNNQSESGKHCLVSVNPVESTEQSDDYHLFTRDKVIFHKAGFSIKIGFCLPSSCSSDDIHTLVQKGLESYSWKVIAVDSCQVKQSISDKLIELPIGSKISVSILGSFVGLSMICSLIVLMFPKNQIGWIKCFRLRLIGKPHFRHQLKITDFDTFSSPKLSCTSVY
ncbi:uncharacterized protein LOC128394084 [Panonychus citri]|uniref:uncharacterized protein LOC128394084 n=1 Tax=Panonychus citri TaxID=50023 RepID=UPI002307A3AC|nr:uncharacterized protein LOC128394084 [Panonychus citri]